MERDALAPAVAQLLADYPVVVTTLVAWGDMDANHHVNNVIYFRYMEHARLRYFWEMGFTKEQRKSAIGPILAWTDCRFRKPLEFPDTVSIGTRVSDVGDDRFTMNTIIVSHKLAAIAAEGQQRLVMYDYHSHHKALLSDELRQRINGVESAVHKKPQ